MTRDQRELSETIVHAIVGWVIVAAAVLAMWAVILSSFYFLSLISH